MNKNSCFFFIFWGEGEPLHLVFCIFWGVDDNASMGILASDLSYVVKGTRSPELLLIWVNSNLTYVERF